MEGFLPSNNVHRREGAFEICLTREASVTHLDL